MICVSKPYMKNMTKKKANSYPMYKSNTQFAKMFIDDLKKDVKILDSIKEELVEKDKWENILFNERAKVFPKQKPILTNEEKVYLQNVIKPFKDQCTGVTKFEHPYTCEEYIDIQLKTFIITLPILKRGKIYKGMELNQKYTLKELDIKYE